MSLDAHSEANADDLDADIVDVLLVEDDPTFIEMYQLRLSLDGYRVSVATDGEAGIAKARELRPDIIFLDIRLPRKDGFEVLEELRRHDDTKHIPVIILSNYGERDLVDRGLTLGANEYLIKAHTPPSALADGIGGWLALERKSAT